MTSAKDITSLIHNEKLDFVSFRFTDLLGKFHQITYRSTQVTEKLLSFGVSFDGSSIAGWKTIDNSDTILKPDLSTAFIDPFAEEKTLILICSVFDPLTQDYYEKDPRTVAIKAEQYLKTQKIADVAYFGPELEFFVFDDVRFENQPHKVFFEYDAVEAAHNNSKRLDSGNLAHRPEAKEGYFPVQPVDSLYDLRSVMCKYLDMIGMTSLLHHHEVASSQCEIGFLFSTLLGSADNIQKFKYVIKNTANLYGKTVTFMPKPIFGDNGSGMHTHQSLWQGKKNLFYGADGYAELSELCLYYIGGIMKHAKAINAFTNPTTNSYKRLVPGYEAPINLAYSASNRSAAIRIPYTEKGSESAKRIEVRFPDPSCNPYLGFAAMLLAGIDGIINKIHPDEPKDIDLYHLSEAQAKKIKHVAPSLKDALDALDKDREFLTKSGVFSDEMIDTYIALKRKEVNSWETAPHPIEYKMYYSI